MQEKGCHGINEYVNGIEFIALSALLPRGNKMKVYYWTINEVIACKVGAVTFV